MPEAYDTWRTARRRRTTSRLAARLRDRSFQTAVPVPATTTGLPMPLEKELSTLEWHSAQVTPIDSSEPAVTRPTMPTTALTERS
jgi:hypothetical protein